MPTLRTRKTSGPFQASIPGRYLYECMGVRRGMWTVSWFRDQFGAAALSEIHDAGVGIEELLNREAENVPPGCEGLITVHDWAPPSEAEFRKGAMIGFDGRHTRAHMYRSVLEGIAFTMKNHMDKMAQELKTPFKSLIIPAAAPTAPCLCRFLPMCSACPPAAIS